MSQQYRPDHIPDVGNIVQLRERLLEDYPDYCTIADVARTLKVDKTTVRRYHEQHIESIQVENITLYKKEAVARYAKRRYGAPGRASRLSITGIDVQRMQQICETYYRTQL